MQLYEREVLPIYEELFTFACPKFVSPVGLDYDALIQERLSQDSADEEDMAGHDDANKPMNAHKDAHHMQRRVFIADVRQQILMPTIRSYLKLYSVLPVAKLASFLEMPQEDI